MYKNIIRVEIVCLMAIAVAFSVETVMAQGNGNGNGGGGKGGGKDSPRPYVVVDLLGLPGNASGSLQSEAVAVNELGPSGEVDIVGNSHQQGVRHPAKWSVNADGSQVTIADLGLMPEEIAGHGEDINNLGESIYHTIIANDPDVLDDEEGTAWVVVPGSAPQELPKSGGVTAYVQGINNSGEIVGYIVFVNGLSRTARGALWRLDLNGVPSAPTDLGDFFPKDISDTGIMVGEDESIAEAAIATLDSAGSLSITHLGALNGHSWSQANAISIDGTWVVGHSEGYDSSGAYSCEAFRWSFDTGMVGLGRFGGSSSIAYGVNNNGQVVGYSDTGREKYSQSAFLWDGQLSELNDLVDSRNHLNIALGINNSGHIAGYMTLGKPASERHGYLLVPFNDD